MPHCTHKKLMSGSNISFSTLASPNIITQSNKITKVQQGSTPMFLKKKDPAITLNACALCTKGSRAIQETVYDVGGRQASPVGTKHCSQGVFRSRKNLHEIYCSNFQTNIRRIKYDLIIKLITRMDGKSKHVLMQQFSV